MRSIKERPTTDYYDDESIKIPNFMVTNRNKHVKRKGIHLEMDAYEVLTFVGIIVLIYCIGLLDIHPLGGALGIAASMAAIIIGGINSHDNY